MGVLFVAQPYKDFWAELKHRVKSGAFHRYLTVTQLKENTQIEANFCSLVLPTSRIYV